MSSRVNQLLQRLERDLAMKKKDEAEKYPRNPETGLPEPKNFEQLLAVVNDMVQMNRTLFQLQRELEAALPKKEEKPEPLNDDQFMQQFLSGDRYQDLFKMVFGVNPVTIALVALDEFFKRDRFVHINPNDLEFAKDLREPYQKEKITNTTIEIGGKTIATPMNNEFWIEDRETQAKFIVEYKPSPGGQVAVTVYSDYSKDDEAMKLISEIKLAVLQSPFIRGQVIEISGGSGFNVVDIGEQPMPIISKDLQEELEKNVINIFDKADEFKAMGQAICRKIILSGGPGNGKCLAKGTPILMFDGTIKPVEQVVVGDKLMGDDSTPRTVLSLARGIERMYKIVPTKGDSYTVNESHILSLKDSKNGGKVVDISVKDYLVLPRSRKEKLKGYRVPADFQNRSEPLLIEPYYLGLWLGDGDSHNGWITTADAEIVSYLRDYSERLNQKLSCISNGPDNAAKNYSINSGSRRYGTNVLLEKLSNLKVLHNKHIPQSYLTSSRKDRLELLAGLIDSDGSNNSNCVDYITKDVRLSEDILFLARSLGFAAYKTKTKKRASLGNGEYSEFGDYYRISISGDLSQIPTLLNRKQFTKRKQIKNHLVTGITVEDVGAGEYFGFEIDGNRRFLLGDFTVTHNTMIERYLASRLSGKVTTIWVSAKSIEEREHIDDIFEIARKLSPALIIMEDLDLISGTRMHYGSENMLGEMLNQLDGLKKNDAVVVVASTNCVADLDEALNDRPERFDRIFEVGKPTSDLAQRIATEYLVRKCNIPEDVVKSLNLAKYFPDKEFSGAQIVEVIRGAIFEAVHRGLGKNINEQCIKASKEGLTKQRDLIIKKQK